MGTAHGSGFSCSSVTAASVSMWRSGCSGSPGGPIQGAVRIRPWGSARQVRTLAAAAITTGTTYPLFDAGPALRIVTLLAVLLLIADPGPHSVLLHRGKGGVSLAARRIVVRCP